MDASWRPGTPATRGGRNHDNHCQNLSTSAILSTRYGRGMMTQSRFNVAFFGLSAQENHTIRGSIPRSFRASLLLLTMCAAAHLRAQAAGAQPGPAPVVPDWALPGSATHKQVPPP